ncbi:hypothetical protein Pth03_25420 [Planotetraspora thailandica]|uniref:Phosphoenolpyruvate synthase n=1 Tax=Planotetraspora thailandica TaxID=487172 RepID=A0A8J3XYC7_9ACTN|nr:PEP/pyruvate-binding domain-containing protein [Planotetraspora thailandica]GII54153.1 hypothetical protein Pth03_25420 [Planotetraspora thailandica]
MIIGLAKAGGLDRALIGGKAANLATLASDFPVPEAFIVTAETDPSQEELCHAAERLGGGRFAVRSSAAAEDLAAASYAGLYETFLNVAPANVADAVRRCRASAHAERVTAYRHQQADKSVAVLVQRMIDADAAGVAFTANPLTGAHDETVITAVQGLGEALVSGAAVGAEWTVRQGRAELTTKTDGILNPDQVVEVAELAQRVQERLGGPQDIEWAIEAGRLYLLQARPMTALPAAVTWDPPGSGLWLRNFRVGEWLPDPVTPLFADWLLKRIDEGFTTAIHDTAGAAVPFTYAVVNGWYYTRPTPSFSALPGALIKSHGRLLPFMVNALIRPGRNPAAADHALLDRLYRHWQQELLPAYRHMADQQPASEASLADLAALVDKVGRMAGRHLWYLAVVGGAAWKMEACLTRFMERHQLGPVNSQILLRGLTRGHRRVPAHAVHSLDWYHPIAGETMPLDTGSTRQDELLGERLAAERTCHDLLADQPRLHSAFTAMLETTQRYAVIREEQARELTLGWPLLRLCIHRIGEALAASGVIDDPAEVFFLTRAEVEQSEERGSLARQRHTEWDMQRRLAAPLAIGTPPPLIGRHLERALGLSRASRTESVLSGQPASAGRATGPVRLVQGPGDFENVTPGDVLVARATAPAWTPLFARVAAVVTDGGTLAAHASLIAREYGIPAVVATGDATLRLREGQIVTVDGTRGIVELLQS